MSPSMTPASGGNDGSLAPGKDADLVVLSPDPFPLPADALSLGQQADLLVIPDGRSFQTCPARHFANGYVRHKKSRLT